MKHVCRNLFTTGVLLAAVATAQTSGPPSPLDELLATPISTAAKYEQPMGDAAASVTVVTAEEIARFGWRTLGEVLSAVRGVYTTSDLGYTYLGVRGIGLPTDYNNRFLVLLDGQPLLEYVSGSIDIGTGLAIDMSTIARIEFVRGPGSVLYGTGAMFGVINLITREPKDSASLDVVTGSGELWTGSAHAGFNAGELQVGTAVAWREHNGEDLYFPEFDTPETNGGIASGRNYDDYSSILLTGRWRNFRSLALRTKRVKGVPTASWGTVFGGPEEHTDGRTMLALGHAHRFGAGFLLSSRLFHDVTEYGGIYPYDSFIFRDRSKSTRSGGEVRLVWDPRARQRVTAGVELVRNHGVYRWNEHDGRVTVVGDQLLQLGGYVQSETQLTRRLSITAGLRGEVSQVTPRGALVFHASGASTIKLLYGQAFRNPSLYELAYYTDGFLRSEAGPERIRTAELVIEHRAGESVLLSASLFDNHVRDLVRLQQVGDALQFRNVAGVRSHGVELQLDHRHDRGIWSQISYSWQEAEEDGEAMRNSPRHLLKAALSTATSSRAWGSLQGRYESGRRTNAGARTDASLLLDFHAGFRVLPAAALIVTVRNAFGARYLTPGGPEHLQDAIPQGARAILAGFRLEGR